MKSPFECPAQRDELGQTPRYTCGGQRVDFGFHHGLACARIGRAVGVDDVLIGAPGGLKGDVLGAEKHVDYLVLLTKRE